MNNQTVLVTGASSGIGLHLAHEFARHGHPLVIVAPVESELRQAAEEFRSNHGVSARVIAKDLEQPEAAQEIFDELRREGVEVEILVNNAGHGQRGKWWEIPIETDLSIFRLNVEAGFRLTKLFLPPMLARGRGRILNVASVAGYIAGPLQATYHASKAALLSWSEALATELNDTNITVTALCPGPVDTDFFAKADAENTVAFQKANLAAPQDVAKDGYEAAMAGERVRVSGALNKALIFSRRFLPDSVLSAMNEKQYEDVEPADRKRQRGDKEREAAAKEKE